MTFQNMALLVALAAVGIPIALHFLARREPRRVVFPSVWLLSEHFETNRSKLRIRRWWLLAFRIAAIALAAFALSRPVIAQQWSIAWTTIGILALCGVALLAMATVSASQSQPRQVTWSLLGIAGLLISVALAWGGFSLATADRPKLDASAPVALAIVVDNGPLSAWQTAGESAFEEMRSAAKQLIAAANSQSRIAVVDRSSTPATFSLDLSGALAKADSVQALQVARPLQARIEAAARLLQTSEIASRQLVVLSNLERSSFPENDSSALAELSDESSIRITVWDLGRLQGSNRSISVPTLSDDTPAPKSPVLVSTILSVNESAGDAVLGPTDESAKVTAECVLFPASKSLPVVRDGTIVRPSAKPVDRVSVQLMPGRDQELILSLPPMDAGRHLGAVRLMGQDALSFDDVGYFSFEVLPPSRLLIVADQQDEANVIERTVSARAAVNESQSQYEIETIQYIDVAASRLTDFDAVILLDPPREVFEEPEWLSFRRSGGSALLVFGPNLGRGPLIVADHLKLKRPWRIASPGTFLQLSSSTHPAIAALTNLTGGVPFQEFRVYQYWQAEPSDQVLVLAHYAETEHPALIEITSLDQPTTPHGRLLCMTTPVPELIRQSNAWNDLFAGDDAWPAFTLVRQLTRYVAGRKSESWSSLVGSPLTVMVEPNRLADADSVRRLQWFPPIGSTPIPIDLPEITDDEAAKKQRIVVGNAKHAGVHWIRGASPGIGFSVNLSRESLQSERLSGPDIQQRLGLEEGPRLIQAIEEMDWTATDSNPAVSLWSPLMLFALVAFLIEQVLGNRFYRSAPSTGLASAKGTAP